MKTDLHQRTNNAPEYRKPLKSMIHLKIGITLRNLLAVLLFSMLAACAGQDNKEVIRSDLVSCDDGGNQTACHGSAYLVLDRHPVSAANSTRAQLGFIEFDDLGFQHYPQAVDHVFAEIETLNNKDKPLLIVMFIHGWHHNAGGDDSNVQHFKRFLIDLQHEENAVSFTSVKRQVLGLYVGWRGESDNGVLSPVTYRSRKNAGLRVGQYGLQEVLAELSKIRNSNSHNRLVAVGHSFGGGVLYSAVLQNLVDKVVSADTVVAGSGETRQFGLIDKAYGDLVILMNPALEAGRVETLHRRLAKAEFDNCQPLVMASFTSEYDTALSRFFPKGQNMFFRDDLGVAQNAELVKTSYGQFEGYRTHELVCNDCEYRTSSGEGYLTEEQFSAAARKWGAFRNSSDIVLPVGSINLAHYNKPGLRPGSPIMNVFVKGENLIKNHNEIWGDDFLKFVRALIGMEFAKANQCGT